MDPNHAYLGNWITNNNTDKATKAIKNLDRFATSQDHTPSQK